MKTFAATLLATVGAVELGSDYNRHQHFQTRPETYYQPREVLKYRPVRLSDFETVVNVRQVPETVYDTVENVYYEDVLRYDLNKVPAVGYRDVLTKHSLTHEHSSGSDHHDHSDGIISLNTNSSESSFSSASLSLFSDSDDESDYLQSTEYFRHGRPELFRFKEDRPLIHIDERQDE